MKKFALTVFGMLISIIAACTVAFADIAIDDPKKPLATVPLFVYILGIAAAIAIAVLIILFVKKRKTK